MEPCPKRLTKIALLGVALAVPLTWAGAPDHARTPSDRIVEVRRESNEAVGAGEDTARVYIRLAQTHLREGNWNEAHRNAALARESVLKMKNQPSNILIIREALAQIRNLEHFLTIHAEQWANSLVPAGPAIPSATVSDVEVWPSYIGSSKPDANQKPNVIPGIWRIAYGPPVFGVNHWQNFDPHQGHVVSGIFPETEADQAIVPGVRDLTLDLPSGQIQLVDAVTRQRVGHLWPKVDGHSWGIPLNAERFLRVSIVKQKSKTSPYVEAVLMNAQTGLAIGPTGVDAVAGQEGVTLFARTEAVFPREHPRSPYAEVNAWSFSTTAFVMPDGRNLPSANAGILFSLHDGAVLGEFKRVYVLNDQVMIAEKQGDEVPHRYDVKTGKSLGTAYLPFRPELQRPRDQLHSVYVGRFPQQGHGFFNAVTGHLVGDSNRPFVMSQGEPFFLAEFDPTKNVSRLLEPRSGQPMGPAHPGVFVEEVPVLPGVVKTSRHDGWNGVQVETGLPFGRFSQRETFRPNILPETVYSSYIPKTDLKPVAFQLRNSQGEPLNEPQVGFQFHSQSPGGRWVVLKNGQDLVYRIVNATTGEVRGSDFPIMTGTVQFLGAEESWLAYPALGRPEGAEANVEGTAIQRLVEKRPGEVDLPPFLPEITQVQALPDMSKFWVSDRVDHSPRVRLVNSLQSLAAPVVTAESSIPQTPGEGPGILSFVMLQHGTANYELRNASSGAVIHRSLRVPIPLPDGRLAFLGGGNLQIYNYSPIPYVETPETTSEEGAPSGPPYGGGSGRLSGIAACFRSELERRLGRTPAGGPPAAPPGS